MFSLNEYTVRMPLSAINLAVRIPTHPATHSSVNRPPHGKAVACWTGATLLVGF